MKISFQLKHKRIKGKFQARSENRISSIQVQIQCYLYCKSCYIVDQSLVDLKSVKIINFYKKTFVRLTSILVKAF